MTGSDILGAMEYSALAYKNIQPGGGAAAQTMLRTIDDARSGVQCYIRRRGSLLSIVFRGTDTPLDWKTDFTFGFTGMTVPYGNLSSKIRVHKGFLTAYKAPEVRDEIHKAIVPGIDRVTVSGHSLGAALAVLCAVDLEYNFPDRDYEVFLFGCPRVGNRAFRDSYDRRLFKTLRIENGNDIVTKVPPVLMGYRHVGIKIHVGERRIPGIFSLYEHTPQSYYSRLFMKFGNIN